MGLRKEISIVVGGLHFRGRRSGLCRGSEENSKSCFVLLFIHYNLSLDILCLFCKLMNQ